MTLLQENVSNSFSLGHVSIDSSYKAELNNIGRGPRVKFHRIEQGLSLKELAAGNLSQENLRLAEMSQYPLEDKIYKKLCLRLGIPLEPIVNPVGEEHILKLKSMLTHIKNRSELVQQFAALRNHPKGHLKEVYRLELMIHSIRYYVVMGDLDLAQKQYDEAEKYSDLMNAHQLFFLKKYRGNIYYAEGKYQLALDKYLGCLTSCPLDLPSPEVGDLYFSLGIATANLIQPQDTVTFMHKALTIYSEMFFPRRIVECHIAIGLAEHRSRNFKMGMHHMKKAEMICEEVDLPRNRYILEYNFAYMYFQFQDFAATIHHTENCLAMIEDGNILEELRCYTILIKANLEMGNREKALNWCSLGTQVIIDMEESSLSNKAISEIFNVFQMLKALLHGNHERFVYLAEEEVIPHYTKDGYDIDQAYYCNLVADYYRKVGETEKAMVLYQKSVEIHKKVISFN